MVMFHINGDSLTAEISSREASYYEDKNYEAIAIVEQQVLMRAIEEGSRLYWIRSAENRFFDNGLVSDLKKKYGDIVAKVRPQSPIAPATVK